MLEGLCSASDSNGDGVMSFSEIRRLFDIATGDKVIGHSTEPRIL
jgi:hypothetical protein